ncbi:MAG TPA: PAS domain S-box protein [Bacteroidota bacterium]|nr:PAS domain S-box protein [Bacteroidota bacterium]
MSRRGHKRFRASLGPLEQAQIVASTAVVVALVTIVAVRYLSVEPAVASTAPKRIDWILFASVITTGIFGFIIVFFTLKYGRLLEGQRQELLALNTIAEAVNRAVEIDYLLQNALQEILRVLDVEYGWIFQLVENRVVLGAQRGEEDLKTQILAPGTDITQERYSWIRAPKIETRPASERRGKTAAWLYGEIEAWVSVPIMMKDHFFGIIIIASKNPEAFSTKQVDLITAFANQIGVAIENTTLFDRLRKSEERYMDLFEHSPDMYHIVNHEGVIISCNQTEAERLGYRKDELIGHAITKLYPPPYHAEALALLNENFSNNREIKGLEEQMVHSNGELIDVSVSSSLIYDESRKPILMRVVARDITEKKKLEAKILHAQRIDSIGNLAGGVAHDFNNILTSILGSTTIMKRKMKKNDQWFRIVDIIETAAKRGASLTRQLLTFARKNNVQFRPIILNDIIEETLHLFEHSIDKTISVKKILTPDVCLINGDDGQVQQALLNLLINARDAMPDGGVIAVQSEKINFDTRVRSTLSESRTGEYVVVSVTDHGIGMEQGIQQRIFEPFFTTKDQGKGTGLGLAVVYGVVNSHNGFITVQSEPGLGSQFTMYFPLLKESERALQTIKRKRLARGYEKVLVVDDEQNVAEVIAGMLTNLGYAVTTVNSGKKAVALYKKDKKYDIIILDMNMPVMGGKETFAKLRALDPDIHIVISTGYANASLESSLPGDSADGFLQKPYQLEELSRTMREVLDKKRSHQKTER